MFNFKNKKSTLAFVFFLTFFVITNAQTVSGKDQQRFAKLDAKGLELPDNAKTWSMVRDNTTGLMWEVKTKDGSINDTSKLYKTWKKAENEFIGTLNETKFGGFSDWRLPTVDEVHTIRQKGDTEPYIDTNYFPNTTPGKYWVYWICGDGTFTTKREKFAKAPPKELDRRVRAVRGGS